VRQSERRGTRKQEKGHNGCNILGMRGRHRLDSAPGAPAAERRFIRLLRFVSAESVLRVTASPASNLILPHISRSRRPPHGE
jgi:hypothetical protein